MAEKLESNNRTIGQLTIDIDCSGALKGLKAITREAKKATQALKELEEQQKKNVDWFEAGGQHPQKVELVLNLSKEADIEEIAKALHKQMQKSVKSKGVGF
jgi:diaminopimelate decarboxylase